MTGQIADHFAQRKIVATDEFLEGTGRNSARSSQFAKSVASTIATSDGPPDPAEPVRDDQSHPSVRLLAAHLPTLGTLQWWPGGPAGRPSWSRISPRSLACRESIGRRQLSGMRFWRRTGLLSWPTRFSRRPWSRRYSVLKFNRGRDIPLAAAPSGSSSSQQVLARQRAPSARRSARCELWL